jgi:hypothetical protein
MCWASHSFYFLRLYARVVLAKIQHHHLSLLTMVTHKHFDYDTVLRTSHCERPNRCSFDFVGIKLKCALLTTLTEKTRAAKIGFQMIIDQVH